MDRPGKLFDKSVEKCGGACEGEGLEGADYALVPHTFGHIEKHLQLAGMVGVIVVYHCTGILPFKFKSSGNPAVGGKPAFDGIGIKSYGKGGGSSAKGV